MLKGNLFSEKHMLSIHLTPETPKSPKRTFCAFLQPQVADWCLFNQQKATPSGGPEF
ncbi:hypothetical protein ADIS_3873 [Lunatimonas lonarensis]|uniref:Uncharacterized protein n=1 Tax=Lunatimonas lonarensis TaxID=1232681 RepID=R7ZNM1_9BACT|nr:hypothetical protein ADIS_3873 [Lunatimonas lonarensis]